VERIAAYIHADLLQLARVIRAAESREALGHPHKAASPMLLAARDQDESEAPDNIADEHENSDGSSR
jgi:hypothetical protein